MRDSSKHRRACRFAGNLESNQVQFWFLELRTAQLPIELANASRSVEFPVERGMATEASAPRRKLSAIVMVDVSGFSRMMGRDEEGTTALIREFHDRTQGLVEAHEGRVVDTAGDSVFGEWAKSRPHK